MKEVLLKLFQGERLSREQADCAMHQITAGSCNDSEVVAFMVAMNMRKLSAEELNGFRASLMRQATQVTLAADTVVDMCGTGGDGRNSFNISTTAAFVVAACGVPVAKHGNHGASSSCGSSTVLEALGVPLPMNSAEAERCFSDCGIVFMHAPHFHPALKRVAPLRQALGCRTFFNILGPLLNPAKPSHQVTGVYSREIQRLYTHVFERGHWKDYALVHSYDGYDELTFTADAAVVSRTGLVEISFTNANTKIYVPDLAGGKTPAEAAGIVERVLSGKGTMAQEKVVAGNAALALQIVNGDSFEISMKQAIDCLRSGEAVTTLKRLKEWRLDE